MTRALLIAVAGALLWAPAAPAAEVMVVGPDGVVLAGPKAAGFEARSIKVGSRTCAVGARTPLSLLAATRLRLGARDHGSCGRSARDAGSIYVSSVAGRRERGRGGWVYKVGRREGTSGAADPSGPFGTGRLLRRTDRVLWFWCELGARGCQRTLEVRPAAGAVAPGAALRVSVRGYDSRGRGVRVPGATVTAGAVTAVADASGVATLTAPATRATLRVHAQAPGMIRSFPARVTVR